MNGTQKQAELGIFISEKADFKSKLVIRNKVHYLKEREQ